MNQVFLSGRVQYIGRLQNEGLESRYIEFRLMVNDFGIHGKRMRHKSQRFTCIAFGTDADNVSKYLIKNQVVNVLGKVSLGYTDDKNSKIEKTQILVHKLEMVYGTGTLKKGEVEIEDEYL